MGTAFNLTPDRVAVFDDSFTQVFQFARPVNARVIERSQMLDHPIETGQLITDYSYLLPIEIEIAFIVEADFYQAMYQQIRTLFVGKDLLTVQTSTASYTNMVIANMPHDERPELYDALPINLSFRQIQVVPNPDTYQPADPTQDDTQSLGQQNSAPVVPITTTTTTITNTNVTTTDYSSVPPQTSSGNAFSSSLNGPQSVNINTANNLPVTGVQTLTSDQSVASAFGGSSVPIGSNR